MSRRMSIQSNFIQSKPMLTPPPKADREGLIKSRWSRLDHFIHKPTKLEELTDVARLLMIAKKEEELAKKTGIS